MAPDGSNVTILALSGAPKAFLFLGCSVALCGRSLFLSALHTTQANAGNTSARQQQASSSNMSAAGGEGGQFRELRL